MVDEIDLGAATVERVGFRDTRVTTLGVKVTSAKDVDLRDLVVETLQDISSLQGFVISDAQLTQFAPLLARHLGAVVA